MMYCALPASVACAILSASEQQKSALVRTRVERQFMLRYMYAIPTRAARCGRRWALLKMYLVVVARAVRLTACDRCEVDPPQPRGQPECFSVQRCTPSACATLNFRESPWLKIHPCRTAAGTALELVNDPLRAGYVHAFGKAPHHRQRTLGTNWIPIRD